MELKKFNLQITRFKDEYRWLSNFWKVEIYYKGVTYPTVEHAYQAQKSLTISDRAWITVAEDARQAKYRGNQIEARKDWEQVKDQIMLELLKVKFSNPELGQKLKDTGDAELVEGNYWHDNYWGDCCCDKCYNKPGKNKLGKMLMEIRAGING